MTKLNPSEKNILKTSGSVAWQSPSNIALIKYWGKYGIQLPRNPSLSISLENAYTQTRISWKYKEKRGISVEYFFEAERLNSFENKVRKHITNLIPVFSFLNHFHLKIESHNSFPHSAGIASSASSMSALALCLCSMEQEISDLPQSDKVFYEKASHIARLGSGSASRSIYGGITVWGKSTTIENSSDEYAIPYTHKIHPQFQSLQDCILIVSSKEKSVSSSIGHDLMNNHPFAQQRFSQANTNLNQMVKTLQQGNWEEFAQITENEALSLHAMMMTAKPGFMLFHPNSIKIIEEINSFRKQSNIQLCYTLDAGPNIHLIYPETEKEKIRKFVEEHLSAYCENGKWIADHAGKGPFKLK
ncbi:MAG: diphosphomevalonate decarboxylase [Bacteroidales bacterium]|nr:diphosphomevalonate decarboxylase [Bacteroidales bacterium]